MKLTWVASLFLFSLCINAEQAPFMRYQNLLEGLHEILEERVYAAEVVRQEFADLQKSHSLLNSEANYREFARVRFAFELTRDSGLWQIRWSVTNQQKRIYPYERNDIPRDYRLPRSLGLMMLEQAEAFATQSAALLQQRRNQMSRQFGGS